MLAHKAGSKTPAQSPGEGGVDTLKEDSRLQFYRFGVYYRLDAWVPGRLAYKAGSKAPAQSPGD